MIIPRKISDNPLPLLAIKIKNYGKIFGSTEQIKLFSDICNV